MEYKVSPIYGFEQYTIDTNGIVINTKTNKSLAYSVTKNGYTSVRLCKVECGEKVHKRFLLHRLILITFLGVHENPKMCNVDHIDNNPKNNNISNLRWITQSENVKRAYSQGRVISPFAGAHKSQSGIKHCRSRAVIGYNERGEEEIRFESMNLAKLSGYYCARSVKTGWSKCRNLIFKYA